MGTCVYGVHRWLRVDRSESFESLAPITTPSPLEPEDPEAPVERRHVASRLGEVASSGYVVPGRGVYGHDLMARGWLGIIAFDGTWLRLYEPSSPTVKQLDFLRGSLTGILVAEKYFELSSHLGFDGMQGRRWTSGVGAGAELRIYPHRHFTTAASFHATIFDTGNPLLDSKFEAGVTFGRFDFRLGGRSIYQKGSASLFGPSVSIVIRLGS